MQRFSTCSHHYVVPKPSFEHFSQEREEGVRKLLHQRDFETRVEHEIWKKRLQDWDEERTKQRERLQTDKVNWHILLSLCRSFHFFIF